MATLQGYSARACGANCDVCPLNNQQPVPPELRPNASIAVVGDYPSDVDVKQGRPLIGPVGSEFERGLRAAGLHRGNVHITNTVLCRPPDGDMEALLQKLKRENEGSTTPMLTPAECCAPRLRHELARFSDVIAMGRMAANAMLGGASSILSIRGAVVELDESVRGQRRRVMPTVHPSFVMKQQRWAHVYRGDMQKAAQWFRGDVSWHEPKVTYHPDVDTLRAFLSQPDRLYAYDVETDGIECLTANLRCIAIGDTHEVMVVGFRGIARPKEQPGLLCDFYEPDEFPAILDVLRAFFVNPGITKVGHNSGYYDRICIRQQLGCDVAPNVDTMLLHKSVESELPHSLAYVASMYTVAPAWKQDREGNKLALGGESDEALHLYCARDVAVTARVIEPLIEAVTLRNQQDVYASDIAMQEICVAMHTVGMFVDQEVRHKKETELLKLRHALLAEIRARVGRADFNPASIYHMRHLLFTQWGLSVEHIDEDDRYTESGDLSTGDLILRSLLTDAAVPTEQRDTIKLLRRYRKALKVLGTYVVKLRPSNMGADLGWDDDEDWADRETRKRYGEVKMGIVNPRTGRMYPGYNAHVAVTGRLSSSKPLNAQNFPKALRAMVVAQPGHVLVGADMDQLELRIAAARWGVELYCRAFREGKDPHSMTAFAVFGQEFCKAAGVDPVLFERPGILVGDAYENGKFVGTGDAMSLRNLSKAVQYASQYMAAVETVHKLIQKTELPAMDPATKKPIGDGITDLPYAKIPLRRVRMMRDNWLSGAPEFAKGWEREIGTFRKQGFLTEDVGGRRRDFLDGEAPNEIVNFPIQSTAAALMNRALIRLFQEIPLHKWGPGTGIINQCHDSIVVECPESEGPRVARLLEECMNQEHPALPGVKITATATIGRTWKEVG
jgi:uracil-DNA glycosylase family 4